MKKVIFYILGSAFFFSTMEVTLKIAAADMDALQLTFIRFMAGGLFLLPFALREMKKNKVSLNVKDYLYMFMLGIICIEMLNQSEIEIYSEEKVRLDKEKNIYKNVYINGRIDLYIKTAMEKIFVDYKSGKLEKESKVENAQRQLDYYAIMLEENDGKEIKKWIEV